MEKTEIYKANDFFTNRNNTKESEHPFRTKFERDRDRILYSKEFRRLSGKTQVFVAGFDDHLRTRLTHTLEVSQIACTISLNLKLNVILTESIALGHDLGHTPFGHVGERTLNLLMNGCDDFKDFNNDLPEEEKGFKHNLQSIRVVSYLETISDEFPGLNLTNNTLWGILNHSKLEYSQCEYYAENGNCLLRHANKKCKNESPNFSLKFYEKYKNIITQDSWTIEGFIVRWADEIAQRNHDIEDGLYSGLLNKEELIEIIHSIFKTHFDDEDKNRFDILKNINELSLFLPKLSSFIVNFYVKNFINQLKNNLKIITREYNLKNNIDFHNAKKEISSNVELKNKLSFDKNFIDKDKKLQKFLYSRILNSHITQSHDGKSNYIIRQLIKAYLTNPQQLPDSTIIYLYRNFDEFDYFKKRKSSSRTHIIGDLRIKLKDDHNKYNDKKYRISLLRTICDYIAGMTDQFALEQYEKLYGGTAFRKN